MKKTVYFLMICIAGLLFSCSEDEGIQNGINQNTVENTFKKSIISFENMKAKLSVNPNNSLTIFSDWSAKDGDDYIRSIDSTYIIQYSNDSLTTFTLRVSTLDDENYSFSNLMIILRNGQEPEELILHYVPRNIWQDAYENGEYIEYGGYINVTDTSGNNLIQTEENQEGKVVQQCEYYFAPVTENPCGCHDGNVIVGYILIIDCGGGGWNDNPNEPNPGSGWPTGPISGGGFGDPDNPGGGTSGGQGTLFQQMNNYFGVGNWLEIDNPPTDLPSFNNLNDAYNYVYGDAFQGNQGQLVNISNPNNQRVTHYKVIFWNVVGERGVRIYVTQTRGDENENPKPVIISITSQWYGGSFYNNWEQHEGYDIEDLPGISDSKRITIYGSKTTGFEYSGHGFFVNTEYKIQFIIDKLGNISYPFWWNID